MGVIPDPRYPKDPQELPRKQKRKPKMCNPQQQSPPQNAAWQGVYPDLSALNELFSTQATAATPGQTSPWIGFLASLGLQPIPGGQTPQQQQQQARPEQEQPSAPPAPEPERQEGHAYAGTNSAAWGQPRHQPSPGASQQPRGHSCGYSCGYSCGAPHISQLLQTITSRLLHFSSVATRASVTFFCIIALFCILSSLPGFLIQSALYVVLATSLLRMPLPTVLAGHLLYSAISFLHPVGALFLLLPCLHKLHVRGQPLGDPASWGVRFTGSNTAWNQHMNHNHQY